VRSRDDDGAAEVGRELRRSIGEWSGQPTFWFVNLNECHSPYLPPRPWNDRPAWERARAALEAKRYLNFSSICLYAAGRLSIPDGALGRMRHLYQRSVSYMDAWLAGVLEALEGRGILEQTLVIVTSDHGENFGEHGLIAHAFSINEHLVHVPLVIAGPGADGPRQLMSLAEMPRLIAAAAGLEDHPWGEDELPAGAAIAQCDPMAPATDARMRNFANTYHVSDTALSPLVSTFTAATDGHHKPDPSDRSVAALRDALAHPACGESGEPTPATVTGTAGSASPEELEAIERQMKLLGYM
jgi:hypothetical protein